MLSSGHRVPVWGGEKVLGRDGGDGGTTMQMRDATELYLQKWLI